MKRAALPLLIFLAACGGGGSDDTVVSSDPAPAPAELTPKTTRMACTDSEGKTPTWWAEVMIDPAEYPWRSMRVTSQYSPYFVSDEQGDIVNARGIAAAEPPPSSGNASQPNYLAQAYRAGNDVVLVMIASAFHEHLDLFTFRTDGTMIQLRQTATASRPETICTPEAVS